MVFDNRNIVMRLNMRRYLTLLAYLVLMGLFLLSGLFDKPVLGYDKATYVIVITAIYLTYIVFAFLLNYNYFSYNDEGNKLIFRFVSLRPFDNKKRVIEIHKKDFEEYKIDKSFFNLKEDLILTVKTKKGVANYPPISITALSLKHKDLLKNSLNQLT